MRPRYLSSLSSREARRQRICWFSEGWIERAIMRGRIIRAENLLETNFPKTYYVDF